MRKQVENIEKNPNSASKSILTDFSEIRIRPKDEIDMNVNLMLKDLRSETRKILEEVKAFRTPAPQWKQSEEIFKREHLDLYIKRKIIDIISDGYICSP